jgi:hypothetical protein
MSMLRPTRRSSCALLDYNRCVRSSRLTHHLEVLLGERVTAMNVRHLRAWLRAAGTFPNAKQGSAKPRAARRLAAFSS